MSRVKRTDVVRNFFWCPQTLCLTTWAYRVRCLGPVIWASRRPLEALLEAEAARIEAEEAATEWEELLLG